MGGVKVSETYRLIDWSYLEELSGGDQEFVQEILETYVETAEELVDSIQAAAQTSEVERAMYAAHTLKGSSRSIGAERLAHLCHELEESLRLGDVNCFISLAPNAASEFVVLRNEIQKRAA